MATWGIKSNEEINAYMRAYRESNREKMRAYYRDYNRQWRKKHGYHNELNWSLKYPERRHAQQLALRAIGAGHIKRLPCERCKEKRTVAHHDDYSKPLEVRFLCSACHRKVHYGDNGARKGKEIYKEYLKRKAAEDKLRQEWKQRMLLRKRKRERLHAKIKQELPSLREQKKTYKEIGIIFKISGVSATMWGRKLGVPNRIPIKIINIKCKHCSETFSVHANYAVYKKFCDRQCVFEYQRAQNLKRTHKQCSLCGETKTVRNFYKNKYGAPRGFCLPCQSKKMAEIHKRNHTVRLKKMREYYHNVYKLRT